MKPGVLAEPADSAEEEAEGVREMSFVNCQAICSKGVFDCGGFRWDVKIACLIISAGYSLSNPI